MNDEELVEVMARRFRDGGFPGSYPEDIATTALAALRSAGFQVYRPEDCEWVVKDEEFIAGQDCFLVPIPGGRDERP